MAVKRFEVEKTKAVSCGGRTSVWRTVILERKRNRSRCAGREARRARLGRRAWILSAEEGALQGPAAGIDVLRGSLRVGVVSELLGGSTV